MMNCEHWRRQLLYLVFSLAFASSLIMMSYIHGSTSPIVPLKGSPKSESSPITATRVPLQGSPKNKSSPITATRVPLQGSPKNESSPITAINVHNKTHEGDSIPLVDFKDLGKSKKRVLLLVTVGSAPQRSDRRQGIRSTWWQHCKHQQVNIIIIIIEKSYFDHANSIVNSSWNSSTSKRKGENSLRAISLAQPNRDGPPKASVCFLTKMGKKTFFCVCV